MADIKALVERARELEEFYRYRPAVDANLRTPAMAEMSWGETMRLSEHFREYAAAIEAQARTIEGLVEALVEVDNWIDRYTPDFVQDDAWPGVQSQIDAALALVETVKG